MAGSALPPDYHSHTELCKHADGTPSDYLQVAQLHGLSQLACTDHCPSPHDYNPEVRMSLEEFDTYRTWVETAQSGSNGTAVLFGIEADFYQGCYYWQKRWFEEQPFDLVLGSVHFQNYWAEKDAAKTLFDGEEPDRVWNRYFKLIGLMAETGIYDIVAHIDLPKKYGYQPSEALIQECVEPALDKVADAGMSIEINTSGLNHDCAEIYPSPQILHIAQVMGISITFGSDAHSPNRIGEHFEAAVALARQAGYTQRAEYKQRRKTLVAL